jgi:hypothetical protein
MRISYGNCYYNCDHSPQVEKKSLIRHVICCTCQPDQINTKEQKVTQAGHTWYIKWKKKIIIYLWSWKLLNFILDNYDWYKFSWNLICVEIKYWVEGMELKKIKWIYDQRFCEIIKCKQLLHDTNTHVMNDHVNIALIREWCTVATDFSTSIRGWDHMEK